MNDKTELQKCVVCGKPLMGKPMLGAKVYHLTCALAAAADARKRFQELQAGKKT